MASSTAPHRIFWDWSRPLLTCAVEELTAGWTGGTLDLSQLAVIVPTGDAARTLRQALVEHADTRQAALLPPQWLLPDGVLEWAAVAGWPAADEAATLLAWAEVLLETSLENFRSLFPRDPVAQDFSWALQMAAMLRGLQHTLGEAGWSIAEAAAWLGADFLEAERWRELSSLEQQCDAVLARGALRERNRVRMQQARTVQPPEGIRRLYVFAVPDPSALVVTAWESLLCSAKTEFRVCIHAPGHLAEAFDTWGRPDIAFWEGWQLPIANSEKSLRAYAGPVGQAQEIARLCRTVEHPAGRFSIGVLDAEILPHAVTSLVEQGVSCFQPQGIPFRQHSLHWVLSVWQELLATRSWNSVRQLLRIPEVLRLVKADSASKLLSAVDQAHEKHLPLTLEDAQRVLTQEDVRLAHALGTVREWLEDFRQRPFDEALPKWLETLFPPEVVPASGPIAVAFRQASVLVMEKLDLLMVAAERFTNALSPAQHLQLLLRLLQEATLFPEASAEGVALSGWLELPWQKAPVLVLAGCNEGFLPPVITSDPWLPHGLRGRLKLKTNEARLARDAYLFTSLVESRRTVPESLHGLFGRAANNGDPLKPARLLMQCAPAELALRVRHLFAETPAQEGGAAAPWQRAWRLQPRLPETWKFTKLSITDFSKYLQCPFRFYLSRVLRMEQIDPGKQELNARDFGNFSHLALEALAKDPELKHSIDHERVAEFLRQQVVNQMQRCFGDALTLSLRIQLSSLQERLTAAASELIQSRLEGWEVRYVEQSFEEILGAPWTLGGIEIRGRIDRVEFHSDRQCWRVIDYKTSAKPVAPAEAHLTKGSPKEFQQHLGTAIIVPDQAKPHVWSNLQVPLYVAALQKHFQQPVEAAYLNLPPALTQTSLLLWPELTAAETLTQSALRCADAVVTAIREGHFWPPNPNLKWDDFESLFIRGVEESIDASALSQRL